MPECSFFRQVSIDEVIALYKKHNYPLKDSGVNIFGIRANSTLSNNFNDMIGVLYRTKPDNLWTLWACPATTDPGLYYRENPCNVNGTAILQAGFHPNAFKYGKHQGKYEALVQNTPLPLIRDADRDAELDLDSKVITEMAGINLHHAGKNSVQVDKWSAGCQVIASMESWNNFMDIIHKFNPDPNSTFDYALFTENDLE